MQRCCPPINLSKHHRHNPMMIGSYYLFTKNGTIMTGTTFFASFSFFIFLMRAFFFFFFPLLE